MVPTTRKPPTPLKTWRNNNVVITSKRHFDVITSKWRRFDVMMTLLLRIESAGTPPSPHPTLPHPTKMTFNEHILSNTLLPINMLCVNKSDKSYPKVFFYNGSHFFPTTCSVSSPSQQRASNGERSPIRFHHDARLTPTSVRMNNLIP